jgi:hypothetical protein
MVNKNMEHIKKRNEVISEKIRQIQINNQAQKGDW